MEAKRVELKVDQLGFLEKNRIVSEETCTENVDLRNDLEREVAYYRIALESVQKAQGEYLKVNEPFLKPSDYFAEMIKSDDHMKKV